MACSIVISASSLLSINGESQWSEGVMRKQIQLSSAQECCNLQNLPHHQSQTRVDPTWTAGNVAMASKAMARA